MERSQERLVIKPVGMTMKIVAECNACKRRIVEAEYTRNGEFNAKKAEWLKKYYECPHCGATFKKRKPADKPIKWSKESGGLRADVKNGTFFVFKWGKNGYRWAFKYNGEREPRVQNQGSAFSKEVAQRICERHKEWK